MYDYIDRIVMIAYFWLSEENYGCADSIYSLLSGLELHGREKERVDGLGQDIKTMSAGKNFQKQRVEIPDACKTLKDRLLWIVIMSITNLFNAGNFELGYMYLMEFAEDWPDVYLNVLVLLKTNEYKEDIAQWALIHALFANDLLDENEMETSGFVVTKIEDK